MVQYYDIYSRTFEDNIQKNHIESLCWDELWTWKDNTETKTLAADREDKRYWRYRE